MLIENLHKRSNVEISRLLWIAATASKRYKVYTIPKRDGSSRIIEHPSKELKAIQRWASRAVLRQLPVHPCATAYKKGAKIALNAEAHRTTNYTVRLDFANFFPSFEKKHIRAFLKATNNAYETQLTEQDIEFLSDIFTRNGHLTIGSPSSPMITNAMMYKFDEIVFKYASDNELQYTRYADDIFLSSKNKKSLLGVEKFITDTIENYKLVALKINKKKTTLLSKKFRRCITGIVITSDHKLSIGRNLKREIKSLIHKYNIEQLSADQKFRLMGLLAYANDSDPIFLLSVTKKYGENVIKTILNQ